MTSNSIFAYSPIISVASLRVTFFIFIFFAMATSGPALYAQDPIYSQFYNNPENINPAFSGRTHSALVSAGMRLQWPGFNRAYTTSTLSYSQFFRNINSGIGGLIMSDQAGDGILTNLRISGYYSYRIQINRTTFLQSGIEISAIQSKLDWDKLVFADQIDPVSGTTTPGGNTLPSSEQRPENLSNHYFDLGFGVLLSSEHFYLGIGLRHLNSPNVGFLDNPGPQSPNLPLLYTLMAGTEIEINPANKISLTPNLLIARQSDLMQINIGANLRFQTISVGTYYRHNTKFPDALQAHLSYRYDIFTLGYAYDFTISSLASHSSGAHEVSLLINFDNKQGRPKVNYSDCLDLFRY